MERDPTHRGSEDVLPHLPEGLLVAHAAIVKAALPELTLERGPALLPHTMDVPQSGERLEGPDHVSQRKFARFRDGDDPVEVIRHHYKFVEFQAHEPIRQRRPLLANHPPCQTEAYPIPNDLPKEGPAIPHGEH